MNDDNHSIASSGSNSSSSLLKTDCPYCNKSFQTRAMFNHIHKKHNEHFVSHCSQHLNLANPNKGLRLFWDYIDDQENEQTKTIYGCLSCFATFQKETMADHHFQKNPKHKKEHILAFNQLKVTYSKKVDPYKAKFQSLVQRNDPTLCRQVWSGILNELEVAKLVYASLAYKDESFIHSDPIFGRQWKEMNVKQLKEFYEKTYNEIEQLQKEKCLIYHPLANIYQRLGRFISSRSLFDYNPEFYFKSEGNPDGLLIQPNDEFGFSHPDMPKVDF